ncbi:putative tartrate transporter [compost metagenome]
MYLSGTGAAAGIALINSVGNLGGFFGPGIVGMAKEATGSFEGGLYLLSALALAAVAITALFISDSGRKGKKALNLSPAVSRA